MKLVKENIENKIFTIRGVQVMLDRDLADMYQVETRILNQAVKRNLDRFPDSFRFQLTEVEIQNLRSQSVISSEEHGGRRFLPYAFTEQGVAMLSAVLRSEIAVKVSIQIMQAFVAMRKTLGNLHGVIQRLEGVELKQLQTDSKLEQIFQALEKDIKPTQGIFFEGQLFDALVFASGLVKKAKQSIVLLDNYVDETTLLLLSKRKKGVSCTVHTRINVVLQKDLEKHNKQYEPIKLVENKGSHDRFLILDNQELYHIGASLKDLGNKCFAFSRMDDLLVTIRFKLLHDGGN
ncbi:ORF6N domain-containing protein [Pleomorphovibrio marinus]|uniref:ORF6N domain-containing protein n=1 Tax=Pleomorphovibrio marinus TaxID=2164132 RepID=UPI000E0C4F12|nr:ORF6N domain-containing protein [Pleomorphovibrio marinus]